MLFLFYLDKFLKYPKYIIGLPAKDQKNIRLPQLPRALIGGATPRPRGFHQPWDKKTSVNEELWDLRNENSRKLKRSWSFSAVNIMEFSNQKKKWCIQQYVWICSFWGVGGRLQTVPGWSQTLDCWRDVTWHYPQAIHAPASPPNRRCWGSPAIAHIKVSWLSRGVAFLIWGTDGKRKKCENTSVKPRLPAPPDRVKYWLNLRSRIGLNKIRIKYRWKGVLRSLTSNSEQNRNVLIIAFLVNP